MDIINVRIQKSIKNAILHRNNSYKILSQFLPFPFQKFSTSDSIFQNDLQKVPLYLKNEILDLDLQGHEKGIIEKKIREDDIQWLKDNANLETFNFNMIIKTEPILHEYNSMSLIEIAAQSQANKCFSFLINANTDIQRKENNEKWGVMEYAASVGNIYALKLLENKGIEITSQTILAACNGHHNDVLLYLIHKVKKNETLDIPLLQSSTINNIEGVEILLRFGANPEANSSRIL